MFVALVVATLIAGSAVNGQAAQVPAQGEAEQLARNGNRDAALEAFRRRAADNPGDLDARVWIGRLQQQMGRPDLAEPVFRSVLLEAPDNVDAAIGLGESLVSLQRGDEALLVLDHAASLSPKNAELAATLGAAHLQASNIKLGLSYLELAVSIAPTPENRAALERARRVYGHRVDASAFFEQFGSGVSDTSSGNLVLDLRLSDHLRLMPRAQYQRKFGVSDQRGGLGLEWSWHPHTRLFVQALAGPDNDVLPQADALIQIGQTVQRVGWDVGYRFVDFAGANVSVFSPDVHWEGAKASLRLQYWLAVTNYDALSNAIQGHSAAVDGAYRVHPRVWLTVGYVHGVDDFDTLSPDRLGAFDAEAIRGGLRLDLASVTSVVGLYEHQWRQGDSKLDRVSVRVIQGF